MTINMVLYHSKSYYKGATILHIIPWKSTVNMLMQSLRHCTSDVLRCVKGLHRYSTCVPTRSHPLPLQQQLILTHYHWSHTAGQDNCSYWQQCPKSSTKTHSEKNAINHIRPLFEYQRLENGPLLQHHVYRKTSNTSRVSNRSRVSNTSRRF